MPVFDEIVVSMSNMNAVRSFDNVSGRHYSLLFFFLTSGYAANARKKS